MPKDSTERLHMLLSIIIATLNAEQTFNQCLQSLRQQTNQNFEVIHIDGSSTDSTMEIASFFKDIQIKSYCEDDAGLYFAMNKGLSIASGEIISILNSDDFYLPSTVEKVITYFNSNPETEVLCGNTLHLERGLLRPDPMNLGMAMVPHPSTFIRSSCLSASGNFDTKYRVAADYDLMLRIKASGATFSTIDETLAVMRAGGYSETHKKISIKETLELQNIYNHWGRLKFIFYWTKYYVGTCFRERIPTLKKKAD